MNSLSPRAEMPMRPWVASRTPGIVRHRDFERPPATIDFSEIGNRHYPPGRRYMSTTGDMTSLRWDVLRQQGMLFEQQSAAPNQSATNRRRLVRTSERLITDRRQLARTASCRDKQRPPSQSSRTPGRHSLKWQASDSSTGLGRGGDNSFPRTPTRGSSPTSEEKEIYLKSYTNKGRRWLELGNRAFLGHRVISGGVNSTAPTQNNETTYHIRHIPDPCLSRSTSSSASSNRLQIDDQQEEEDDYDEIEDDYDEIEDEEEEEEYRCTPKSPESVPPVDDFDGCFARTRYLTFPGPTTNASSKITISFHPGFWEGTTTTNTGNAAFSDRLRGAYLAAYSPAEARNIVDVGARHLEDSYNTCGAGLLEVERSLHRIVTNPPGVKPFPNHIKVAGGVPMPILRGDSEDTGPSYFVTVHTSSLQIPYVSDCYESLANKNTFVQSWILLVRSAVIALLARTNSQGVIASLCCREFVHFAYITPKQDLRKGVVVHHLRQRLFWNNSADRKEILFMSLAIAAWLRSTF